MLLILDEDQPLVFVRLTLYNHVNQSQLWLVVCAAAINAEVLQRVEYEILLPRESLYNTILQGSASQAQVTFLLDNFYPFDNNFTGVACRSRRHWDSQGGQRWPPHPVATPSSPAFPDLNMQIDFIVLPESHLSRRWTLGKLQSLRHVRVVRASMSKSVVVVGVCPKGDWTFVLHILGQILAHNSILHATAGSKFLRVQVASFSITLHRTPPSHHLCLHNWPWP